MLAALAAVDFVTIFPALRVTEVIDAIRPAIYVKGGDYRTDTLNSEERAVLERIGAQIRILPFAAGYSTSALIERLQKTCAV